METEVDFTQFCKKNYIGKWKHNTQYTYVIETEL